MQIEQKRRYKKRSFTGNPQIVRQKSEPISTFIDEWGDDQLSSTKSAGLDFLQDEIALLQR